MVQKALKAHSLRETLAKTVRLLIKDGIEVRFRGHQPYVASKGDKAVMLVLPELNDNASPELLSAIQGYLDHEVGHILYTPFEQQMKFAGKCLKRKTMLNIVEDIRLEKLLPRDLPGTKDNLERMYETAIPVLWAPPCAKGVASPDASTRFSAVIIVAMRALAGQKAFQEFMDQNDYWPHFQPLLAVMPNLSRRLRAMETSDDACSITEDVLAAIDSIGMMNAVPPPPPVDTEEEDKQNTPPNTNRPEPEESDEDSNTEESAEEEEGDGDEGDSEDTDGDEVGDEGCGGDDDPSGEDDDDDPSDEDDDDEDGTGHGDDEGEDDGSDEESCDCSGDCSGDDKGDDDGQGDSGDTNDDEEGSEDSNKTGKGGKTNFTITDALKMLDASQRRALFLYKQRKQTVEQIASDMNKTEGEVEDLLRIARRKLNDLLNGDS